MSNYQIEYNGITTNQADSKIIVTAIRGLHNIEIRSASEYQTNTDGGFMYNQKYGFRIIEIDYGVVGDDVDDLYDQMELVASAFSKSLDTNLAITIETRTRTIDAYVIEMAPFEIEQGVIASGTVQLLCTNPFFRDTDSTVLNLTLQSPGGFDIPFDIPFDFVGGGGNPSGTITSNTDNGVDIVYELVAGANALVNPTIVVNGNTFGLNTTIPVGVTVTITDTLSSRTISASNGANYFQYLYGNRPTIVQGANPVSWNASTYSSTAQLNITYSQRYGSF